MQALTFLTAHLLQHASACLAHKHVWQQRPGFVVCAGELATQCSPQIAAGLCCIDSTPTARVGLANKRLTSNNKLIMCAGELAIQCSPEQLQPLAAPIVERLVPILAAPMAQMPRSIVENRSAY